MMKKQKRILAFIAAVLLLAMYGVVFFLGITASPSTQDALMAAIICTLMIPFLLYAILLLARILGSKNKTDLSKEASEKTSEEAKDKK